MTTFAHTPNGVDSPPGPEADSFLDPAKAFEKDGWRPTPLNPWGTDQPSGKSNYQYVLDHVEKVCDQKTAVISRLAGDKASPIIDMIHREVLADVTRAHNAHHRSLPDDTQDNIVGPDLDIRRPDERVAFLFGHPEFEALELCQETHGGIAQNRHQMIDALGQALRLAGVRFELAVPRPRYYINYFDEPSGLVSVIGKANLCSITSEGAKAELVHRSDTVLDLDAIANLEGANLSLREDTRRLWRDLQEDYPHQQRQGSSKVPIISKRDRSLPRLLNYGLIDHPFSPGVYPALDSVYAYVKVPKAHTS